MVQVSRGQRVHGREGSGPSENQAANIFTHFILVSPGLHPNRNCWACFCSTIILVPASVRRFLFAVVSVFVRYESFLPFIFCLFVCLRVPFSFVLQMKRMAA